MTAATVEEPTVARLLVTPELVEAQIRRLADWHVQDAAARMQINRVVRRLAPHDRELRGFWSLCDAWDDLLDLDAGTYEAPVDADPDRVEQLLMETYEAALDAVMGRTR